MTTFEKTLDQVRKNNLKTPDVSYGGKNLDYFGYQLAVHKYNLGIMKMGMTCKGIKLKDIKEYYGLKGKTADKCLEEFMIVFDNYKASLVG
jgi:hypothetical protein